MTTARLRDLAVFGAVLAESVELEDVIDTALSSFEERFGFRHVLMMLQQPEADRLTTIASRGYDVVGIGSEVRLGEGVIGTVAESRQPMRIGNLQRMLAYLRTVQHATDGGSLAPVALPGLANARSQLAAPMVAGGILIGVIAVESERVGAFGDDDQLVLTVAAQLVAGALERAEAVDRSEPTPIRDDPERVAGTSSTAERPPARLKHYTNDGSTFIDDEYVIKGVAGRLLWKLAGEHVGAGRTSFTNRETRLDPALEMPSFRDNFESRLVLLKRRLDERDAPLQIRRTGRGRFEVSSRAPIVLERVDVP